MTLRLIVSEDEEMIPQLIPTELVAGSRPNVGENQKDKSPGFTGSEFQAQQVGELLALGLDEVEISSILKVSVPLLKFYYANEFETSEALVNARVAKQALNFALDGRHPEMTQFWLKTRAGWNETRRLEITGADGGPIEVTVAREGLMKTINEFEQRSENAKALEAPKQEIEDAALVMPTDKVRVSDE